MSDLTPLQQADILLAYLSWYGMPFQYETGEDVELNGEPMKKLQLKDWIPEYLPIEIRDEGQELAFPVNLLSLADAIHTLEFGETISWLILGGYRRRDGYNDTILNLKIDTNVDWLKIEVPQTIPNDTLFKVLFTLKKTKSLMKMIRKIKTFWFAPSFSGECERTF